MGLTVSHGAFDGPYGAFTRWREALAIAAGKPPLTLMEGHFMAGEVPFDPIHSLAVGAAMFNGWGDAQMFADKLYAGLPIRWAALEHDYLNILLSHSDCDGQIEVYRLADIAGRLEFLAKKMSDEPCVRGASFKEVTIQFAQGCRAAAEAGEALLFE